MASFKSSAGLSCQLGIQPPDGDDSHSGLVVSVRMVIDGLKSRAIGGLTAYQPFCAAIIDPSIKVAVPNGLLNFGRLKSSVTQAHLGVLGPDEALNPHHRILLADAGVHHACITLT